MLTRTNLGIGAAVLLVVAGAFFYATRSGLVPAGTSAVSTSTPASSTTSTVGATSSVGSVSAKGSGEYEIKILPSGNPTPASTPPPAPNHKLPLTFNSSVSVDQRAVLNARLALVQAALTSNAYDMSSWIELGGLHETAGDYDSARIVWEYVSKQWPGNSISFNNLGDLYMNYIHDYQAAESNYLKQIQNSSSDVNAYRALFTLYTQLYKQGTSAAEDILKRGIAVNPKAYDLQVLLARLYRDSGRMADAKVAYEAAIANAKAQGLVDLAAQIEAEEEAL
ncbi:MAG TPA: hypothetical protein VJG64_04370 [Candidatus Paceibacterota bacterium]